MKGRSFDCMWADEVNEMRPEAVPVQVPGVLPEDGNETPLLEAQEEVPLGLFIQDTLPGMEDETQFHARCEPV